MKRFVVSVLVLFALAGMVQYSMALTLQDAPLASSPKTLTDTINTNNVLVKLWTANGQYSSLTVTGLTVVGNTTNGGTLTVNTNILGLGNLVILGTSYFDGNVDVTGRVYVSGAVLATGASITGNSTNGGTFVNTGAFTGSTNGQFNGNLVVLGTTYHDGNVDITGTVYVSSTLTANSTLTGNTNAILKGSTVLLGPVQIDDGLSVTGGVYISGYVTNAGIVELDSSASELRLVYSGLDGWDIATGDEGRALIIANTSARVNKGILANITSNTIWLGATTVGISNNLVVSNATTLIGDVNLNGTTTLAQNKGVVFGTNSVIIGINLADRAGLVASTITTNLTIGSIVMVNSGKLYIRIAATAATESWARVTSGNVE